MFRRIPIAAAPADRRRPNGPGRRRRRGVHVLLAVVTAVATLWLTAGPALAATGPVSSANARWLDATYTTLLGRPADDGGLDHHLAVIAAGGSESRRDLAHGLLVSPEGSRAEVRRAYGQLLGRSPDPVGEDYWTTHLSGHGVLDLRVLLMAGDEFHLRAGGTDDAWITALYQEVLGRSPEAAGRAYWLGLVQIGVPRAAIAGAIYQSPEALGRRVDAYYQDLLGRSPSAAERAGGANVILASGERRLRAQVWASDESFESFLDAAWS
ncbi:MAG: DUF4214 domain-containing protein [Actinomycetota bacterium]